jgi:hypothetical protein
MQFTRKMTLAAMFLAATGFAAVTPAQAILVQHNGNTIVFDSLQGHDVFERPGSPWDITLRHRVTTGATNNTIQPTGLGNVLVVDGGIPGAPPESAGGVDGHTKYLHLTNNGDRPRASVEFAPINSGSIYAEFMLYTTDTAFEIRLEDKPAIGDSGGSGGSNLRITHFTTTPGTWDINIGGNVRESLNVPWVTNQWVKVQLTYNFVEAGNNTFELIVNGVSSGLYELHADVRDLAVNNLTLKANHNTAGDIYIGSTVPEPASLALLGLGGLLLMRRSRQTA